MTNRWNLSALGGVVTALAALVALLAFSGTSSAQETSPAAASGRVAIAIGQLSESDGETATVDLRARSRGLRPRGSFRFFSEEYGYYNGGVRSLRCEDGVITAKGAGKLTAPDGTRTNVVYEAVFDGNHDSAVITVKGKGGLNYTMEGTLDGLIRCGSPTDEVPAS